MKLSHIRTGLIAAAAISFLLAAAPAVAQDDEILPTKPTKDQDSTPGLQQTPDGQTMKTAGEKIRPMQEVLTGTGGSTGPTFPKTPLK